MLWHGYTTGPPVKRPVLAPLALNSSTTVYICTATLYKNLESSLNQFYFKRYELVPLFKKFVGDRIFAKKFEKAIAYHQSKVH